MKINPNIIVQYGSGRDIQNMVSMIDEAAKYSELYINSNDEKICDLNMRKYEKILDDIQLLYSKIFNSIKLKYQS